MLRVRPFRAVHPDPNRASRVAAPPYDVVNAEEARAIAADNPDCFLHISRAEIDLPPDTDPYSDAVYDQAKRNYQDFLRRGALVRDAQPRLFLYRLVMQHRSQIGVVCCCHVDDYLNDVIRKHEKTRPDKEDDRTRHTLAINANSGPVFLTYRDRGEIDALVERDTNERPLFHFNAPDGVTHTAWPVEDVQAYLEQFARIEAAYVADGHHRSASAARAGAEMRSANPQHTGEEEYNWFLAALFPASQLSILPYNRVVADLNGLSTSEVLARLAKVGSVSATDDPIPGRAGEFCFYLDEHWRKLSLDPKSIDRSDPVRSLDVALLQDRVLGPILGIGDPRVDKRVDFVGGIRGPEELQRRVDSGKAAIAFSICPTTMEQLLAVSDSGGIMPPKSTWFEPKLRSGLFVHELGGALG